MPPLSDHILQLPGRETEARTCSGFWTLANKKGQKINGDACKSWQASSALDAGNTQGAAKPACTARGFEHPGRASAKLQTRGKGVRQVQLGEPHLPVG